MKTRLIGMPVLVLYCLLALSAAAMPTKVHYGSQYRDSNIADAFWFCMAQWGMDIPLHMIGL